MGTNDEFKNRPCLRIKNEKMKTVKTVLFPDMEKINFHKKRAAFYLRLFNRLPERCVKRRANAQNRCEWRMTQAAVCHARLVGARFKWKSQFCNLLNIKNAIIV